MDGLRTLLERDPVVNLFLLGFLAAHPLERAWWVGACEGDRVMACLLIIPGRLAVPYCPDPAMARSSTWIMHTPTGRPLSDQTLRAGF